MLSAHYISDQADKRIPAGEALAAWVSRHKRRLSRLFIVAAGLGIGGVPLAAQAHAPDRGPSPPPVTQTIAPPPATLFAAASQEITAAPPVHIIKATHNLNIQKMHRNVEKYLHASRLRHHYRYTTRHHKIRAKAIAETTHHRRYVKSHPVSQISAPAARRQPAVSSVVTTARSPQLVIAPAVDLGNIMLPAATSPKPTTITSPNYPFGGYTHNLLTNIIWGGQVSVSGGVAMTLPEKQSSIGNGLSLGIGKSWPNMITGRFGSLGPDVGVSLNAIDGIETNNSTTVSFSERGRVYTQRINYQTDTSYWMASAYVAARYTTPGGAFAISIGPSMNASRMKVGVPQYDREMATPINFGLGAHVGMTLSPAKLFNIPQPKNLDFQLGFSGDIGRAETPGSRNKIFLGGMTVTASVTYKF